MHTTTTKYIVEIHHEGYGWVMEHAAPFIIRQRAEDYYEDLVKEFPNSKFRLMHRYTMDSLIKTNMELPEEDIVT